MASTFTHLKIPLEDIQRATNNFADENIIGKGGFGSVYKGQITHRGEPTNIAARRLDRRHGQGDVEFWTEIDVLSSLVNESIVELIGYVDEKDEKIIVNRDCAKGSLVKYLNDPITLTWSERVYISRHIADAINYIHHDLKQGYYIIHRNINSFTILLDDDWEPPRLSGFEFCIKHPVERQNQILLCDEAIGTKGYMDPADLKHGGVTHKSDVYSFGVVLFELLCGRKAKDQDNELLASLAKFHYENGTLQDIIHPDLWNQMDPESFKCFSEAAYSCLEEERQQRPNVKQVLDKLQKALDICEEADEKAEEKELMEKLKKAIKKRKDAEDDSNTNDDESDTNDDDNDTNDEDGDDEKYELEHSFHKDIKKGKDAEDDSNTNDNESDTNDDESDTNYEDDDDEKYELEHLKKVSGLRSASSYVEKEIVRKIEKSIFTRLNKCDNQSKGFSRPSEVLNNLKHLRIRLSDIQLATDNFSRKYMIGTHGGCYKAELECFDREYLSSIEWKNNGELPKRRYTVKLVTIRVPFGEVYNEIEILSNCKHRNIETLLGFCKEGPSMILVYEYVSTKCLRNYLDKHVLTWEKRLKICLDIAHGLNYLHHEMEGQKTVIHCDINSKNIELDVDWEAKVIGFGKSIYLPPNQDDDALYLDAPQDFNYYMDPEYIETTKLKRESDVYSFGAIMFEILCGMSAKSALSKGERLNELVKGWLDEGIMNRKVAPILMGENGENSFMLNKGPNRDSLDTFINIASQCFAEKQNQRPTMKVVIKELEKALSFQENNKDILRMSLEDIKLATQDFNCANAIGGGGFGRVYKGEIAENVGNGHYTIVAKQLDTRHGQGEKQFYNELQILYEYKHENIISLVGYSNETDEKIIVYEHAPKGSLDKYLSDTSLTWKNRLKICIDFATGLDFLHGGGHGQEAVIHRDIKAANILLFDDWKAKVGDFGLSMISTVNKETDYIIDHACGTKGYLDPLYLKSGFLTLESVIYSFGVVLFEILCGRTTFAIHKHKGLFLPSFIKHIFKEGKQGEVVFHAIKDEIVPKSLTTFQNIAYQCLDDDREKRPTSKEVLAQLKKAMEFQVEDKNIGAETS